jgi:predicted permease
MPETFGFPLNQQLWTLLGTGDEDLPVEAFGRMNPGADTRAATVEATARWVPDIAPGGSVQVLGFTEARGEGGENAMLLAVLALVLVLVLVSCSNVSNLLLMRGLDRGGQLAVHQALGASPSQVGWLVLAESAIIAGIGAAVGAGVAWAAIGFIQESLSGHWGYHWMHVAFRPRTVLFLAGLGAVTSLVAGFIPAVRAFGADVRGGLSARESRGNARGLGWVGPTLLTAQVSLSFLFLLAAVLIGRGLWSSRAVNPAFPADEVFLVGVQRPDGSVDRPDFARAVERALLTDPAVGNAAVATGVPGYRTTVRRLERPSSRDDVGTRPDVVGATAVTPGYFDLFGIPTLRGRTFQAGDMAPDGPRVAVVSRAFAEEELGTMEATGLRVSLQTLGPESPVESFEILGVVDDVRIYSDQPRGRPVYLPLTRDRTRSVFLLFRGENLQADQARLAANRALAAIDPDLPLEGSPGAGEAGTVGDVLDYIRTLYSTAGIMGILGGAAAVAVAVMGLYGILSYQMRRRRRELGIRVALGAGRSSVITQVVSLGLRSLAPGLVLGCVAALAAIPLLGVLLGSGRARDGLLFGAVAAAYALVGLAASLPPALRASRTDPNLILRED